MGWKGGSVGKLYAGETQGPKSGIHIKTDWVWKWADLRGLQGSQCSWMHEL